jgi:hypothetical protein
VIIDGVAVIGANGWNDAGNTNTLRDISHTAARFEDMAYLNKSIEKLQKHLDVKRIIVVSNAVPSSDLYFRETPEIVDSQIPLCASLISDTEHKVRHWVFGSYDKTADTYVDDINYINNPYLHVNPYWAKRITISV